jgi:hypothetical protein
VNAPGPTVTPITSIRTIADRARDDLAEDAVGAADHALRPEQLLVAGERHSHHGRSGVDAERERHALSSR